MVPTIGSHTHTFIFKIYSAIERSSQISEKKRPLTLWSTPTSDDVPVKIQLHLCSYPARPRPRTRRCSCDVVLLRHPTYALAHTKVARPGGSVYSNPPSPSVTATFCDWLVGLSTCSTVAFCGVRNAVNWTDPPTAGAVPLPPQGWVGPVRSTQQHSNPVLPSLPARPFVPADAAHLRIPVPLRQRLWRAGRGATNY